MTDTAHSEMTRYMYALAKCQRERDMAVAELKQLVQALTVHPASFPSVAYGLARQTLHELGEL